MIITLNQRQLCKVKGTALCPVLTVGSVLSVLCELTGEIFTTLCVRYCHHAHFTNVETEALLELHCQRSSVAQECKPS